MKRFGSFCTLLIGAALVASAVPAYPEEQQATPESGYIISDEGQQAALEGEGTATEEQLVSPEGDSTVTDEGQPVVPEGESAVTEERQAAPEGDKTAPEGDKAAPMKKRAATPKSKHKVIKGDTLWDLSGSYLKDPYMWPEIHKVNPKIKNPHWIYPGQKIVIPGMSAEEQEKAAEVKEPQKAPAAPAAPAAEARPAKSRPGEPFVEMGKTIIKKKDGGKKVISLNEGPPEKLPIATTEEVAAAGFLYDGKGQTYEISGDTLDGRVIYSAGDELLIEDGENLGKGRLLLIGRPTFMVEDPSNGDNLGRLIDVSGILRVTGMKDGRMAGIIEKSFREVRKTDTLYTWRVMPPVYDPVPANESLEGQIFYVAATKMKKDTSAFVDIVYLNKGSLGGLRAGDKFVIRRSGGIDIIKSGKDYVSPGNYELPDKEVGEVRVISAGPKSAVAKVTYSDEIVKTGYRAIYKY